MNERNAWIFISFSYPFRHIKIHSTFSMVQRPQIQCSTFHCKTANTILQMKFVDSMLECKHCGDFIAHPPISYLLKELFVVFVVVLSPSFSLFLSRFSPCSFSREKLKFYCKYEKLKLKKKKKLY